jgi:DNA-binding HxlR family transcriptional regulator
VRAGTSALSLLSLSLSDAILRGLAEQPRSLVQLRRAAASPSESTMRLRLQTLIQAGAVDGRRQSRLGGSLDYELTPSGRRLLRVADILQAWLQEGPDGPLLLGGTAARSAVKSLVAGWGTSMLRALAARPLSLTELDSLISGLSYPALERRLTTMRLAGHLEALPTGPRGTPHAVTDWLRRGTAPLAIAMRWEREDLGADARPISNRDIEAFFLLAVPLVSLPAELSGRCRLSVEMPGANGTQLAGATVDVEEGRIASCTSRMEGGPATWISGPIPVWSRAVIEHRTDGLEVSGDCQLATALVEVLHETLFAAPPVPDQLTATRSTT